MWENEKIRKHIQKETFSMISPVPPREVRFGPRKRERGRKTIKQRQTKKEENYENFTCSRVDPAYDYISLKLFFTMNLCLSLFYFSCNFIVLVLGGRLSFHNWIADTHKKRLYP